MAKSKKPLPDWLYNARSKAIRKKGGLTYSQITKDEQPGGVSKRKPAQPIPFQKPRKLKKLQEGGVEPIYTSDPKDPRLQAYRDSSTLYNEYWKTIKESADYYSVTPKDILKEYKENRKAKGTKGYAENEKYIREMWGIKDEHPTIKPTAIYDPAEYRLTGTKEYKKPVQPVKYKKPEDKLILSKTPNTELWTQPDTNLTFEKPEPQKTSPSEGTFAKNEKNNTYSVYKNNTWYPTTETTALGESKRLGQSIQTFKKGGAIMRKKLKTPKYDFGGYAMAGASGALSGASMGSAFGPIGTGIGAGVGLIGGLLGESQEQKAIEKDPEEARMTQQPDFYAQPAYFKYGGNTIEVEGGELEVKNGRKFKEFEGPSHNAGGYTYEAKPNRVIISKLGGQSNMYLKSGHRDRVWSENTHILNQRNRMKKEEMATKAQAYDQLMKQGGRALTSYSPKTKGRGYAHGGDTEIPEYAKGGRNFKSASAYKAWLAYGHASGEFAKTPGHQKVSIKGVSKKVKHMGHGGSGDPMKGLNINNPNMAGRNPLDINNPFGASSNAYEESNLYNSNPEYQSNFGMKGAPLRQQPFGGAQWNPNWGFGTNSVTKYQTSQNARLAPNNFPTTYGGEYAEVSPEQTGMEGMTITSPGTQNKPFDWQKGLNTAAPYLSPLYNTLMAFQPTNTEKPLYNPYEKRSMDLLQKRVDPSFGLRQIDLSGQRQRKAMSGLGSMSQGQLLSNFAQSGANEMGAKADYIQGVNRENMILDQGESAGWRGFGQERVGAENYAAGLTRQNKVNKAQYLPKALTQFGQIGRENQYVPMYADYMKNSYLLKQLEGGADYKTAKAEADKKYGVNYGQSSWYQHI